MEVDWRDVSVVRGQKQILFPCSGCLQPGRMVALMGASGSGKTTLLSCLRQDISHSGEVRFDGARFCKNMRQLIGYAEQDDVIIPGLTVSDSLLFLAEMRYGMRSKEAVEKTGAILRLMRLEKVAHTQVGEPGMSPRISGGERKRMCIGRELLAEPELLLCDEPTSGLDSTMANQVVAAMRGLCDSGRVSLVSSIHQPSTAILEMFDDAILLREGIVIYHGPVKSVEASFTSCGPQRNPSQSVAEYLMDCLVLPEEDPKGMSDSAISTMASIVEKQRPATWSTPVVAFATKDRFIVPFGRQVALLLHLFYKVQFKLIFTKVNAIQNLCLMLVPALLCVNLGFSDLDVHPRFGLAMWTIGTWMFFPLLGNIMTFQTNRRILEKELKKGCYSLEAFYVCRTLLLLPLSFFWPLVWTAGVYWISNVNPNVGVYLQLQLLVFLSYSVFEGVGQAISACGMSTPSASTLSIVIIVFCFGWSGFFMEMDRVPAWVRWLTHGNIFMYDVQLALQILLSSDLIFSCDGYGSAYTASTCGSPEATFTGVDAQALVGIDRTPGLCLTVLVGSFFFFRLLAYGFLRYNLHDVLHGVKEDIGLLQTTEKEKREQDTQWIELAAQREPWAAMRAPIVQQTRNQ